MLKFRKSIAINTTNKQYTENKVGTLVGVGEFVMAYYRFCTVTEVIA